MNIDINKYKDFYNEYNKKINLACLCIDSNSCTKVSETVSEAIQFLNNQINNLSDWDDTAKDTFMDNLNICISNLEDIKDSIDTNWVQSEKLYKDILTNLNELQTNTISLESELGKEPKISSFRKEIRDGMGNIILISYPGYGLAFDSWKEKCRNLKNECSRLYDLILENINQLKNIDGIQKDTEMIGNTVFNLKLSTTSEFAYFTEDVSSILNSNATRWSRVDGKLTIRYNQGSGPWITTIDGVSLKDSGCGIMSLATALTSAFTYQSGQDVIVTPSDVAHALSDYAKANGKSGLNTYFPKGMGDYDILTEAISDIYGVTILYDNAGNVTSKQISNATDTSGTIIYSMSNKRHIAAITGVNEQDQLIIADTGKGLASYVDGTSNYKGAKRSMIVTLGDFTVSGNKLVKNGSTQIADIGDMDHIVIDGKNYNLNKQAIEGTDLYEYIIDYDS